MAWAERKSHNERKSAAYELKWQQFSVANDAWLFWNFYPTLSALPAHTRPLRCVHVSILACVASTFCFHFAEHAARITQLQACKHFVLPTSDFSSLLCASLALFSATRSATPTSVRSKLASVSVSVQCLFFALPPSLTLFCVAFVTMTSVLRCFCH